MAVTYDIYLHDLSGGNGGAFKPTEPKKPTLAELNKVGESETALNIAKAVGVATAAAIVLDKTISALEPFVTSASGDYRFQIAYGNFKQSIANITNPKSAITNYLRVQHEYAIINRNREEQRKLFGDSIINYNGGNV